MVELTPKDRLQPSLLDRLTDNEPDEKSELPEKRVLSMKKLRECVLRDLAWLFNSGNMSGVEDLDKYPLVAGSVLNYGIRDLTGATVSGIRVQTLEKILLRAIVDFEPRILKDTVKVRSVVDTALAQRHTVAFEVEGLLWGQPAASSLYIRTEIDVETGHVSISEYAGSSAR
jgi:type VI secretion system protein ImpF